MVKDKKKQELNAGAKIVCPSLDDLQDIADVAIIQSQHLHKFIDIDEAVHIAIIYIYNYLVKDKIKRAKSKKEKS